MLVRYLNVIAVAALVGSAGYAYSIKYETILYSAKIQKLKNANQKLRDQKSMLRAEWTHISRPERIQALADRHLPLKQLELTQIVDFKDIPERPPKVDSIGRHLKLLGLAEPTATPRSTRPAKAGATPSSNAGGGHR